jgi:hypothetical protein
VGAAFENATLRLPLRTWHLAAAGAGLVLVAFGLLFAASMGFPEHGWAPWVGLAGVACLPIALVAAFVWARWPPIRKRTGSVVASEKGLLFGGTLVAATPQLLDGRVRWRKPGKPYVDFMTARIQVDVPRDEDAFALIDALALERERGIASFVAAGLPHRWATILGLLALAWLTVVAMSSGSFLGAAWFVALVAVFLLGRTWIRVGRDGVLVQCIGWSRFTPYEAIARVERVGTGLLMYTDDGKRLHLPGARGLEGTLDRAIARSRPDDDVAKHLSRAGRAPRDWFAAVRGMRPRPNDVHYRVAQVPESRLWDVVEDGRAERSARIGAAVALADGIDEAARSRMREAARATADPELRGALECVAESRPRESNDEVLAGLLESWPEDTDDHHARKGS